LAIRRRNRVEEGAEPRNAAGGVEDISPDPFSEGALATWKRDPKELERTFASTMG
jgi:hypothetical protein